MAIPLDRLYNFLDGVSRHDLIIYRWHPNGSKKIQDLTPLENHLENWRLKKTRPILIFHDQEPLDYEFNLNQIDREFKNLIGSWAESELFLSSESLQELLRKIHIAIVCDGFGSLYDSYLLVHSEKNSHQVSVFEKNNFIPVYYWNHAVLARDWFRYAEHDPLLKIKSQNPKVFLIYNRAWSGTREYRLKFAENLIKTGLHQDCITSFSCIDNQVHYRDHNFKNANFKLSRFDLEEILSKNNHDSAASADYNNLDYQNSMIEVVLETLFDDTRNHLTEKILRPIACRQPFILASTPGSLKYLRSYGFKTFSRFINETYDTIVDPLKRIDAILQEMQRIYALTQEQKNQLIQDIQPIVQHNQKLFFSDQFHKSLISEFKENLDIGIEKLKSGSIGKNWKFLREVAEKDCPELFLKHLRQDHDDIEWVYNWIDAHSRS
jgi:hypothetical protein